MIMFAGKCFIRYFIISSPMRVLPIWLAARNPRRRVEGFSASRRIFR